MSANVVPHEWKDGFHSTPGYKIYGSHRGYTFITAEDAYDVCCRLAELIDRANGLTDD